MLQFVDKSNSSLLTYLNFVNYSTLTVTAASNNGQPTLNLSVRGTSNPDPSDVNEQIAYGYSDGGTGKTVTTYTYTCGFDNQSGQPYSNPNYFVCTYPEKAANYSATLTAQLSDGTTITSQPFAVNITGNEMTQQGAASPVNGGGNSLLALLNNIISFLLGLLQELIYKLFSWEIAPLIGALLKIPVYTDAFVAVIYPGWIVVRNLCDMFFIIALIVIAMATLFRVESYQFRHLLIQLIVAALLVNFSLVIGQSILGLADTVQAQFLGSDSTQVQTLASNLMLNSNSSLLNAVFNNATTGANAAATNQTVFAGIIQSIFWLALSLGTFFVFGAICAFMFIRIVALWLLLLVSPIAYAVGVLPSTAQYRNKWWQEFLKYAFFTPIMAFFLNMAAIMAANAQQNPIFSQILNGKSSLPAGADSNLAAFLVSVGSDVLILVFLIASLKVADLAGVYGAEGITSIAQKGIFAPFQAAAYGLKAARNYGAEKVFEKTGFEVRPSKWLEGWKHSREENKAKREARGQAVALSKGSPFGNPTSFFQRYWNPGTIGRLARGGDARGRRILVQAEKVRQDYMKETDPAKKEEMLDHYRHLVHQGKHLIAPTDYHTQKELRGSISEEKNKIHSENWHELVDLFNASFYEGESIRAAAIATKLAETYNENELIMHSRYTRDMSADESADDKAHKAGEFFEFSAEGGENFRKLIFDEQLGLGDQVSRQIMNDISDIAESHNHREIMRMYGSKDGKLYFKKSDERVPEVVAEMNKLASNKILGESNRLVGNKEVADADYDITDKRTSVIEPALLTYYMQNYSAVGFLAGRGQINASQAIAAANPQNEKTIMDAAALLDGTKLVPDQNIPDEKSGKVAAKTTARQQYVQAMNILINYGKDRSDAETGKSKVELAADFMKNQANSGGQQTSPRPQPPPAPN